MNDKGFDCLVVACMLVLLITMLLAGYWHYCEEMAKISAGVKAQEGGAK